MISALCLCIRRKRPGARYSRHHAVAKVVQQKAPDRIMIPVARIDDHRSERHFLEDHLLHRPMVMRGRYGLNRLRKAAHIVAASAFMINQSEEPIPILLVVSFQLPRVDSQFVIPAQNKLVTHIGDLTKVWRSLVCLRVQMRQWPLLLKTVIRIQRVSWCRIQNVGLRHYPLPTPLY